MTFLALQVRRPRALSNVVANNLRFSVVHAWRLHFWIWRRA